MSDNLQSFRLSPQQESILAAIGDTPAWQCTFVLPADSTADDVHSALRRAIDRHEILRTTFVRAAGARVPVAQTIHDVLPPAWHVGSSSDDLASIRAHELESRDLESGPVLRAVFVDERPPSLTLTAAAACLDLPSLLLLAEELSGTQVQADPLQYADYADWRSELLAGDDTEAKEGREAWTQLVAAMPQPESLLFGEASDGTGRRAQVTVPVTAELVETITASAAEQRVALELFVEAAWHSLLARLSGGEEIVAAGLVDGRSQSELKGAIGPYAHVLPIRTRIEDETSFAEVLDRVRRERNAATRRQDYVNARQLTAIRQQTPAAYIAADSAQLVALASTGEAPPLELVWLKHGRAFLQFDPTAYGRDDIEQIATHLCAVLASAAADPTERVHRLNLLDEHEHRRLLSLADGPAVDVAPQTLHELFEAQAARTPNLNAVAAADEKLSYAELNVRANRLAHHLRTLGVTRNEPVGLCLDRSPAMLTALLAILKAGGAYLPLNFEHPRARLSHQIAESGARIVVTQSGLLERLPAESAILLSIDDAADEIAAQSPDNPELLNEPEDLVYVMYTSGSTGLPKGVAVTHRNVVNYTVALTRQLECAEGLNFAVVSAISTDLGNTAIFPALVTGGCVHLVSPQMSMDGETFSAYAVDNPIDVLKITPSHLRALLRTGTAFLPRRWLVLGGEASSWDLVDTVRSANDCAVLNHYGPTETTIGACTYDVVAEKANGGPATLPIGRPIANLRAYILGPDDEPAPIGVAGELCIGGAGVARGYVNRPDETNARFVPDRFAGGGRVYRTGDRARFLRDGNIEFLGRIDQQLKIRGFRVEPGEIEAALVQHPAISEAAVVPHADGDGDPRLVAHFVSAEQPDSGDLRAFLGESLPEFMIPSLFEPIDALPLTPSGKVDRRALPEPGQSTARRNGNYVAPRDDLEADIAAIWEQLLGVEQVGVNDDFFALGGHSLLATQAIIRIRRGYGNIPLGAMFNASTVAALADVIRASGRGAIVSGPSAS